MVIHAMELTKTTFGCARQTQGHCPNLLSGAVVNEDDRYEELLGELVPGLVPNPEPFYREVLSLAPVDARIGEIVPSGEQSDHLFPVLVMCSDAAAAGARQQPALCGLQTWPGACLTI